MSPQPLNAPLCSPACRWLLKINQRCSRAPLILASYVWDYSKLLGFSKCWQETICKPLSSAPKSFSRSAEALMHLFLSLVRKHVHTGHFHGSNTQAVLSFSWQSSFLLCCTAEKVEQSTVRDERSVPSSVLLLKIQLADSFSQILVFTLLPESVVRSLGNLSCYINIVKSRMPFKSYSFEGLCSLVWQP